LFNMLRLLVYCSIVMPDGCKVRENIGTQWQMTSCWSMKTMEYNGDSFGVRWLQSIPIARKKKFKPVATHGHSTSQKNTRTKEPIYQPGVSQLWSTLGPPECEIILTITPAKVVSLL
jgi:hypothetical protein